MLDIINNLKQEGNYRELHSLKLVQKYIISGNKQYKNLSSNDYLGIGGSQMQKKFLETVDFEESFLMGTPSSRLMTGNVEGYTKLENKLADIFQKESAIVLSSGFLLNSGALPALTQKGDLVIADKLVHASIIEGLKLCQCKWLRYKHNDMDSLKAILEREADRWDNIFVVTESIFSMDGDIADLQGIVALKKEYKFKLYLDEAHAFGVRGESGYGVAQELGLTHQVDYMVATMGKAIASQGAFIACDKISCELLINRMRTLIFSTALPEISLLWSLFVIEQLPSMTTERQKLTELSTKLSTFMNRNVDNSTHIIPYMLGSNNLAIETSQRLREAGFWVTAIKHPTVPKGTERLRISLSASLDIDDLTELSQLL